VSSEKRTNHTSYLGNSEKETKTKSKEKDLKVYRVSHKSGESIAGSVPRPEKDLPEKPTAESNQLR